MHRPTIRILASCVLFAVLITARTGAGELFSMPAQTETRWFSFENPTGAKGAGGMENHGAKGHAYDHLRAGETRVLMDYKGSGIVRRMWFTIRERTPEMLRSLRLRMYWDGAEQPAVDVPFGDYFGAILGEMKTFESHFFASPEGRSFIGTVPMPFRTGARITITNESDTEVKRLFYDINITTEPSLPEDTLFFHAVWNRIRWTELGEDFTILPRVSGRGRFLGAHVGVITHPDNIGWWGEGEVRVYLDGESDHPTLVGTGTEDYIGTGWGQGTFNQQFQGCLFADNDTGRYSFYRFHVPDPIYFQQDIQVNLQSMGGTRKENILKMLDNGVSLLPVTVSTDEEMVHLLAGDEPIDIRDPKLPDGWTNTYRRDDYSAVAFFYLDRPENGLPALAPVAERVEGLGGTKKD